MDASTGIDAWIHDLRARFERGDLADLGPIDLGYGTEILPGELTVRIMLVDLDDLEAQIRGGSRTILSPRWQNLIRDFRRLRDLIG